MQLSPSITLQCNVTEFPDMADSFPNACSHLQDNLLRELHVFSSMLPLIHILFGLLPFGISEFKTFKHKWQQTSVSERCVY